MKLIEFKEYNNINENKALNKKKIAITIIIAIIVILITIFLLLYIYNKNFRNWADMHVLMKNVTEGTLSSIDIDVGKSSSIYAYDKYVAILDEAKIRIYNSSAKEVNSIDMSVNNPILKSNGKYLVIGEKGKQKIHLVSGTKSVWDADVEGSITRAAVNENGYVSVVCSGNTYKSIITVFNQSGEKLFKTYIPNNTVIDSAVSSDNKYLSFAEIDTTKTMIQSIVKTMSIKDASNSSENSIVNTYELPINSLVVNIKYQGSKNLICMCDNGIQLLSDGNIQELISLSDQNKKYTFAGIDLSNTVYEIEEYSDGISNQNSNITLMNTGTKKYNSYTIEGIAKETSCSDNNIAINLGTEIYFINSRGWLIKKYMANQEIRDVIVSDKIAAIIFRDKVEILIL